MLTGEAASSSAANVRWATATTSRMTLVRILLLKYHSSIDFRSNSNDNDMSSINNTRKKNVRNKRHQQQKITTATRTTIGQRGAKTTATTTTKLQRRAPPLLQVLLQVRRHPNAKTSTPSTSWDTIRIASPDAIEGSDSPFRILICRSRFSTACVHPCKHPFSNRATP